MAVARAPGQSLTMNGSRAILSVDNVVVGIFDSVRWSSQLGNEAIHILGRFSPAEIAITSYEAITVDCSGFRVINNGAHTLPKFPTLQQLLTLETMTISVVDSATQQTIMTVLNCVPVSYSDGDQAKTTSKIQIQYKGTVAFDESSTSDGEAAGATSLPG